MDKTLERYFQFVHQTRKAQNFFILIGLGIGALSSSMLVYRSWTQMYTSFPYPHYYFDEVILFLLFLIITVCLVLGMVLTLKKMSVDDYREMEEYKLFAFNKKNIKSYELREIRIRIKNRTDGTPYTQSSSKTTTIEDLRAGKLNGQLQIIIRTFDDKTYYLPCSKYEYASVIDYIEQK